MKLGEITKIRTGKLDANAATSNGIYPFFTCSKDPLRIDHYAYDCECVLVAGNGDLNVKYYSGKFEAYQRTYIIETNEKLKIRYLYWFMVYYIDFLRQQTTGGVIKFIKLGNLTDASINLPSKVVQLQRISVLDKLNKLIEDKKKYLENLDSLVKSLFVGKEATI